MTFDKVRSISPSRSKHKLYNKHFFDTHIGWFIPVWQYDCAPTTSIKLDFNLMLRSKLIPQEMYGGLKAYFNAFFCAYRNLDSEFEDNVTGGDGKNVKTYHNRNLAECLRESSSDSYNAQNSAYTYTLHDYFGLPCVNASLSDYDNVGKRLKDKYKEDWIEKSIHPYFFAAYHKIWNEYCRPEHFVDDDYYDCANPPSSVSDVCKVTVRHPWCISDWLKSYYARKFNDPAFISDHLSGVRRVCNNKDYFVSCLPTQQRGVAPTIAMQGILPIEFFNFDDGDLVENVFTNSNVYTDSATGKKVTLGATSSSSQTGGITVSTIEPNAMTGIKDGKVSKIQDFSTARPLNTYVAGTNLSSGVGFDISELRVAAAIQKWQEVANVCGTRYTEYLRGMYSVAPRDDRLQRPEWIGGAEVDLNTFTVTATADSATSNVGDDVVRLGGRGNVNLGNYFAPEYGCIIVTMHIKPEVTYNKRLDRSLLKLSRYDWHNPLFNGIGEDAIRNSEIWNGFFNSKTTSEIGKQTFGFLPRNANMCTAVDYVSGSFCSGGQDSIKTWIRDFGSQPNLNSSFLMCKESEFEDQFGDAIGVPFECCVQSLCTAVLPVPVDPSPADVAVKY